MPVSSDFEVMPESSAEHPREGEQWGGGVAGCKRDGESVWAWQWTGWSRKQVQAVSGLGARVTGSPWRLLTRA